LCEDISLFEFSTEMNKSNQDKNFYLGARKEPMYRNQSNEKLQRSPGKPILFDKEIAIINAYASFGQISEEFNIPLVNKTFGKGIVRILCRTITQLDNIPLIIKELIKFHLIEEIGMKPLAYSSKMKSLVLFFKPTGETSRQKIVQVFQKCSFKYHHLVIHVDYPVTKKGSFKSKRIAVENAHSSLRQILHEFNIPCVKETFGLGIVRVCCRSVVQLENITLIMKELLAAHLIEEVRMPLEYSYKMSSLVLFLKPVDIQSNKILGRVFKACIFKYHHIVVNIEDPAEEEEKMFEHQDANETPMKSTLKIIIWVTIGMLLNTLLSKIYLIYRVFCIQY